jgi:hypothetical protein
VNGLLERIIARGNRGPYTPGNYESGPNWITCADGFKVSVIAGNGAYCSPRPSFTSLPFPGEVSQDYPGPYTHVEVGFPSERPEPWDGEGGWAEYAESPETHETVYGQVPVEMVRALIDAHGGER